MIVKITACAIFFNGPGREGKKKVRYHRSTSNFKTITKWKGSLYWLSEFNYHTRVAWITPKHIIYPTTPKSRQEPLKKQKVKNQKEGNWPTTDLLFATKTRTHAMLNWNIKNTWSHGWQTATLAGLQYWFLNLGFLNSAHLVGDTLHSGLPHLR